MGVGVFVVIVVVVVAVVVVLVVVAAAAAAVEVVAGAILVVAVAAAVIVVAGAVGVNGYTRVNPSVPLLHSRFKPSSTLVCWLFGEQWASTFNLITF